MQKQYQLKTTLPAWLTFAGALLMLAAYWVLMIVYINVSNATLRFNYFGTEIGWIGRMLLDLPHYVLWAVMLILARRLRNPFVPLIVLFAFHCALQVINSVGNWITYTGFIEQNSDFPEMYERVRLWNTLLSVGYLALIWVPGLLNSLFWHKKWIYLVLASLIIVYTIFLTASTVVTDTDYGWTLESPHKIQAVISNAGGILFILSWLLYAMKIQRVSSPAGAAEPAPACAVPEPYPQNAAPAGWVPTSQAAAPAGWIPPSQAPAADRVPPSQAPAAAPEKGPEPQPQAPAGMIQCPACGAWVPERAKFCPKCGGTVR